MKSKILITILILFSFSLISCNKSDNYNINNNYINDILNAYNYHLENKNFKVTGTGEIETKIITQKIKYEKTRTNDNLYYFNATYGSKLGIKINNYIEVLGDINKVSYNKGLTNSSLEKTKETSNSNLSYKEFLNIYGISVNDLNYIIKKEYIKSIDKENDTYILTLKLDKPTTKYKKQIIETNPYETKDDSLKFLNIKLKIELDENLRFKQIEYLETYELKTKVLTWVSQKLNANIIENFNYEGED